MTLPRTSLTAEQIGQAIEASGLDPLAPGVAERFAEYYALLDRWNSRLNLTAIRDPEEALRRHFVECIFCAQMLPLGIKTLLDYGSGAGFPGIPIALCRPEIRVTLAESQGKKASFLREAVRTLGINASVYSGRVEDMPVGQRFDAVSLRAVDKMREAVASAAVRVREGGYLVLLATRLTELPEDFSATEHPVPSTEQRLLIVGCRRDVPRETHH